MSTKCIKSSFLQKTVPCDLCKEVLMVVEQLLKDNATEVCEHDNTGVLSDFNGGQSLNSCVESRANSSDTWRRPVS